MTLRMELEFRGEPPIVPAGQPVEVQLNLKNIGDVRRVPTLYRELEMGGGKEGRRSDSRKVPNIEPSRAGDGRWLVLTQALDADRPRLYATFQVRMHGRPVVQKRLAVLSTGFPLPGLTQDRSHNLRDAEGRLVVLKLADLSLSDVSPRRLVGRSKDVLNVLVLDEGLGGAGSGNSGSYYRILERRMERTYQPLDVSVQRPKIELGEEFPPIQRFLEIQRHVGRSAPNLVILACQPESVVNTVPPKAFETYLVAAVDQILSQTPAHVLLITPPPLPGRPELARDYARVTKKTGLRKGLVVADLYSRFMLTGEWKSLFKAEGSSQPAYRLYPNRKGQRLVSREVFAALVGRLHRQLSAVARRQALQRN
jgi:hypothetical protein